MTVELLKISCLSVNTWHFQVFTCIHQAFTQAMAVHCYVFNIYWLLIKEEMA